MTWTTYHRREDAMRDVIAAVDARADGRLPMDLPGVAETFGDDRPCSALSSCAGTPAWPAGSSASSTGAARSRGRDRRRAPADRRELPGVRAVLDRHGERQRRPENAA